MLPREATLPPNIDPVSGREFVRAGEAALLCVGAGDAERGEAGGVLRVRVERKREEAAAGLEVRRAAAAEGSGEGEAEEAARRRGRERREASDCESGWASGGRDWRGFGCCWWEWKWFRVMAEAAMGRGWTGWAFVRWASSGGCMKGVCVRVSVGGLEAGRLEDGSVFYGSLGLF